MGRRLVALLAWTLTVLAISAVLWLDYLQRHASGLDVALVDANVVAIALAAINAATVGVVLASRRPRHPVGWLLLAFGSSVTASGLTAGYGEYGLRTGPGALPAARYVGLCFPVIVVTALALLGFVLLLTPTGSLPSPRWRWWARITAAMPVVGLLAMILASQPIDQPDQRLEGPVVLMGPAAVPVSFQLPFAVANLAVVVGAASLVARFSRARGIERQQLRWVALAAVPVALGPWWRRWHPW